MLRKTTNFANRDWVSHCGGDDKHGGGSSSFKFLPLKNNKDPLNPSPQLMQPPPKSRYPFSGCQPCLGLSSSEDENGASNSKIESRIAVPCKGLKVGGMWVCSFYGGIRPSWREGLEQNVFALSGSGVRRFQSFVSVSEQSVRWRRVQRLGRRGEAEIDHTLHVKAPHRSTEDEPGSRSIVEGGYLRAHDNV
ncbi:hypothetical protein CRG98_047589 [Punica granatum]|uniref:Uncharacterized protein n=1 Tax=Punica granatum TaxID=22663 RepID=A0A2I0HL57_PUNGR|nr:hypothetical protein CRG98_047589 [Punica granatum]